MTTANSKLCVICDAPLPPIPLLPRAEHPLCRDPQCRFTYDLLRRQRRLCASCGRPLPRAAAAGGTCPNLNCRHASLQAQLEADRKRALEAKLALAARIRDEQAPFALIHDPDAYLPAVIPALASALAPLPKARLRAYRRKLKTLIRKALAEHEPSPPPRPDPPTTSPSRIQAQACAICRGNCCRRGGEHAYLNASTITRFMAGHPGITARQVFQTYARAPGPLTFEGSCVNHGPLGCTLPREARSDTCNDFLCEDLRRFARGQQQSQPSPRVFFLALDETGPITAAFIEESTTTRVPLACPPALPAPQATHHQSSVKPNPATP